MVVIEEYSTIFSICQESLSISMNEKLHFAEYSFYVFVVEEDANKI